MTLAVAELDELPAAPAADALRACCAASRWVAEMVARRPYHTLGAVLEESDDVWRALEPSDWIEAFAQHPRAGEPAEMADAARAYERRFGYAYVACAAGRSADELLALARARLGNDAEAELRVAADEQRLITRLRLQALLRESPGAAETREPAGERL